MRISDWSSDVCSSDLEARLTDPGVVGDDRQVGEAGQLRGDPKAKAVNGDDDRLRVPPYRLPAVEIAAPPRDILGWRSAAAIFAAIAAGAETLAIAPYADHGRAFPGHPLERGRKGPEQRCGKGVRCPGPIKADTLDGGP